MRLLISVLIGAFISLLILSFFGVYSGNVVTTPNFQNYLADAQSIEKMCKNNFDCPSAVDTSGFYCISGSVYKNQTAYRCNLGKQACVSQPVKQLVQHCNKDSYCVDGISECQPSRFPVCSDSDKGRNFRVAGVTSNSIGEVHSDYCSSRKQLVEGYCNATGSVLTIPYACNCDLSHCTA